MRKGSSICSILLLAGLSLTAQGHPPATNHHSNAPGGLRDREFGKDRAADAGKGKKEGLDGDQGIDKGKRKAKGHKKHDGKEKGESLEKGQSK